MHFPEDMVEFLNLFLFVMRRKRSKKEDVRNTLHVCIGGSEERSDYLRWHRPSGLQPSRYCDPLDSSLSCGDPNHKYVSLLFHNCRFTTVMNGDINI